MRLCESCSGLFWGALGGVCIKILQAAADPFVTILRKSFTGPGTKIQNIFYNSLQKTCGDPRSYSEMPSEAFA